MAISDTTRAELADLAGRYPQARSALLPMLHLVQSEEGYVTPAGIAACAETLSLSTAEVAAVATFYTMYKRRPTGKHHIGVCTNTMCAMLGGDAVWAAVSERAGCGHDEVSEDGTFDIERIECQAACTHAPVMTVDWEFLDNVTPTQAVDVLDALAEGREVRSTRGPAVRGYRAASRTISGIDDDGLTSAGPAADEFMQATLVAAAERGVGPADGSSLMTLTPVVTAHWDDADCYTIGGYLRHGGYAHLRRGLTMAPDDLIALVKQTGLRGRGGAGFPTGLKWSFVPQGDGKAHYLVVNADESEPGACKDIPLMMANPHALVEGCILTSYAIRANHAFIYVRGEVPHVHRRLRAAVREAYHHGYLGRNIMGTGFDLDLTIHAGAGAYICGEETALLDSLEGRRGQPRLKPPFPAVAGLYASPTVVNNVETIANVPYIVANGADWFTQWGTEKSPGFKLMAVSGHVRRPGVYEVALGTTMRQLLEYAGGMRNGGDPKFWLPGGSSVPMLTAEHLDLPLTYEDMASVGTMLGTATPMVFDDTVSVVKAVTRWLEFYKHESCGKCTPCREGTYWIAGTLEKFESGHGQEAELDMLVDLCSQILGRSFCALGDAAATPFPAALKHFRDEFLTGTHTAADAVFDPLAATVMAMGAPR